MLKRFTLASAMLLIIAFISCKDEPLEKDTNNDNYINTKSLLVEDIQAAIDTAISGDIIKLPEGTATWETTLTIPDDKKITLFGKGVDKTIISTSENAPRTLINMSYSGSRVTNIGFELANDNGDGISVGGIGWRIDNCKFDNMISHTIEGVVVWGTSRNSACPTGVVDHCEFNSTRALVVGYAGLLANEIWSEPLELGTDNAVFIEDCIFNFKKFGNAIDANYGGRYVFRYNTLYDVYIEAHSVQGNNRAARSWEIYENIINKVELAVWTPFFMRGGTGVIFNNTITGYWSSPTVTVDNRRSFETFSISGTCDGTSPWDGNEDASGYPARDQIGRSTDAWLWTESNPYPTQTLDPMYQWNNLYNGSEIEVYVHNNCGIHIKKNRDYYDNIAKPGYTPYEYPHPLIKVWEDK
jgi:hypothetical protein